MVLSADALLSRRHNTHYAAAVGLQKWKMTIMAKKWGDGTDVGGFSFVCFFADVQSEFKARSVLKIAARV